MPLTSFLAVAWTVLFSALLLAEPVIGPPRPNSLWTADFQAMPVRWKGPVFPENWNKPPDPAVKDYFPAEATASTAPASAIRAEAAKNEMVGSRRVARHVKTRKHYARRVQALRYAAHYPRRSLYR
jgi:hypothetical protein